MRVSPSRYGTTLPTWNKAGSRPVTRSMETIKKALQQPCKRCNEVKLAYISARCKDMCFFITYQDSYETVNEFSSFESYPPMDVGLMGDGDNVTFIYCLNCGQIQGQFPV